MQNDEHSRTQHYAICGDFPYMASVDQKDKYRSPPVDRWRDSLCVRSLQSERLAEHERLQLPRVQHHSPQTVVFSSAGRVITELPG